MDALLSINPGTIIWTIVNFSILMLILGKLAFPAIVKSLKEREDSINNAIKSANEANQKAQDLLKESQQKFDNAHLEVKEIIANSRKQAEQIVAKAGADAEAVKKAKIEETLREIQSSKDLALAELRSEVANLVIMATERLLDSKLNKDEHLKLVQNYIEKLPRN